MKNMVSSIWKMLLPSLFVCCMFTPEVSAQPPTPDLTVVQPYYNDNGPPEMYLQSKFDDRFYAVEGIRFCKKVEGGSWGPWEEGQLIVQPLPSGVGYGCVNNSGLLTGKRYTYQVQLKVRKGGTNTQEWTKSSNLRSNSTVKIWPVTKGACSEPESINVLHGFNQVIEQITRRTLHEGIDITGEQKVDGECVRAPMGGVFIGYGFGGVFHLPENMTIALDVHVNGEKSIISFNHLENLTLSDSDKNKSIEPGTPLGEITSRHFSSTEANHIHFSWSDSSNRSKNPSEIWDQTQDMYRDPQGSWPVVEDTNSDSHAVRFRKGPHETAYLPDDGIVYGPVDLVVEARDHQSSYYPWQNPLRIGYYIQKSVEGETFVDVVQSSGEPYVLIDGTHWFGFPYSQSSPVPLSRVKKLAHIDEDHLINEVLKCKDPNTDPPPWDEWFTYIVTNTKGTQGILADLDAGQCWATDARNTETSPNGWRGLPSPDDPEDFVPMYETARLSQDAKFPDGKYRIRIRLEDYAHEVTDPDDPENGDHKHEVIVDNFLPYIEEVEVTTGGETIYEAGWFFSAGDEQLNWVYYAEPKDPTPGEALNFRIQTSETMQWLSVTLPGSQSSSYLVAAPNSQGMVWEATLYPKASNESTLTFQGQDMADHPLLAFSETQPAAYPDQIPKPVPKRDASGDWPAEYDALRQDTSGDTLHQLGALPPPPVWSLTTPIASICEEINGGVICSLKEKSGASVGTGSVALGPQDFLESPPAEGPFVILNPGDRAGLTHTGLYGFPDEGLELTVQPRADWLEFCEGPTADARCPGSPPDAPGHRDPPELPLETQALTWQMTIDTNQETETCQIQVTWEHEDGQPVVSFTLTEQSLTDLRDAGVPDEIVTLLTSLQDQVFPSQQTLLAAVEAQIESEAFTQYQARILSHAERQPLTTTLEMQPATVCEGLSATTSGTVNVTATCTWDVLETTTYEEYEQPETVVEPSEMVNMPLKYLCEYYTAWWPSFVYFYGHDCQENPGWAQPPENQSFGPIIPPGEEDFSPTQLVAVRYSGCQWEEWPDIRTLWVNGHKRYGPVFLYDAETCRSACPDCANTDACTRQLRGRNTCEVEREYRVWNCRFEQRPGTMTFTNPAQLLLDPEP